MEDRNNIALDSLEEKFQDILNTEQFKTSMAQKQLEKKTESLDKSIQDLNFNPVLEKVVQEMKDSKSDKYSKKLFSIYEEQVTLLKKQNKLSEEQKVNLEETKKNIINFNEAQQQKIIQEKTHKRENEMVDNPLAFLKHTFDELSDNRSQNNSLSETLKNTTKTFGQGLTTTLKNVFTSPTSMMHIAGVALDSPALNILADTFKKDLKSRDELIAQEADGLEAISDLATSDDVDISSSVVASKNEQQDIKDASDRFEKLTDNIEETKKSSNQSPEILKELNENISLLYTDLGSILENIYGVNSKMSNTLDDILYFMVDSVDDKVSKSKSSSKSSDTSGTTEIKSKEQEDGLLEDLLDGDLFDSRKGGKGKRRSKSKIKPSKGIKGLFSKGAGALGKGAGMMGGMAGGAMSALGKVALPLALLTSAYEGVQGYQNAGENFDLKEGQDATMTEKLSSAGGSIASGLTFGLLDEKTASQGIKDISSAALKYSGTGLIKDLMTDDDSQAIVDKLEQEGVVSSSLFGDSEIRNWDAIQKLTPKQLDQLIRYDDWDEDDIKKMKDLKESKEKAESVQGTIKTSNKEDLVKQNSTLSSQSSVLDSDLSEKSDTEILLAKWAEEIRKNSGGSGVTVVSGNSSSGKPVDNIAMEDDDLVQSLQLKGLKV